MTHDLREKRVGRECPAQWSWIVPPLGGSLTSVFHHEMRHFDKDPRFVYQVGHSGEGRLPSSGAHTLNLNSEGF